MSPQSVLYMVNHKLYTLSHSFGYVWIHAHVTIFSSTIHIKQTCHNWIHTILPRCIITKLLITSAYSHLVIHYLHNTILPQVDTCTYMYLHNLTTHKTLHPYKLLAISAYQCMSNETPITISESEVYFILKSINTNKATGPDKLSGRIIKQCVTSLVPIIHTIFNNSIEQCVMPALWKIGEIVPVQKKPLPKVDNDLRPVTLTAILAKCFERALLPKITTHTQPVMDKMQFAYQANRSTDDAIITLIHEIAQHLDGDSTYARSLFLDYSSAFNTMQPHILISRLAEYNIPARLQLLVLDFLTNRQQYVRTECEISSSITINTGAPQGCVLSAFLFIVYTNALSLSSENCKIIKYADDTVVIGLISDNNEKEYKSTIDYVSHWCSDNFLDLNASKTKEIVFDMRKNKNSKEPVIINNTSVALIQSYKYLGVTIQENLKWNEHVEVQEKKANKRMYHVRRLKKQTIDSKIICLFYNSVVSSVLVYGLSGWFEACTEQQKKKVSKFQRQTCKITNEEVHASVETPSNVYKQKCISLITKIVNDKDHYLHNLITVLPHGHLRAIKCTTERSRKTFLPVAVKLFNAK